MDMVQEVLNFAAHALGLQELTVSALLRVALMALVGLVIIRLLMRIVDRLLDRAKSVVDIRIYIRSAIHVFLWFLLALVVAGSLGADVSSVIAMLSVAGLAVSLALQNTLSNLAGGLMILVTKPFAVGDYIDADGTAGTVSEIGLAYTKLTTPDSKRISVPNSQMSAAKIVNYTNEAKAAILEAVAAIPAVRRDPEPVVWISAYRDSAIDYVVRAWTSTEDYWDVYNRLMEEVRESFARHGVEMTYNHLNVHLLDK